MFRKTNKGNNFIFENSSEQDLVRSNRTDSFLPSSIQVQNIILIMSKHFNKNFLSKILNCNGLRVIFTKYMLHFKTALERSK